MHSAFRQFVQEQSEPQSGLLSTVTNFVSLIAHGMHASHYMLPKKKPSVAVRYSEKCIPYLNLFDYQTIQVTAGFL